ncbi:MAG: AMP-binding protein [Rubrivivax sp.]
MDLIRLFDHGAALDPERACFVEGERRTSYRETQALTERIARKLQSIGIARDRKVGVLSVNSGDAFSCVLGTLRAGAVWVPLNPRSAPAELAYVLDAFDVEVLVFHSLFAHLVDALRPSLSRIRAFVCIDREQGEIPALATWLEGVPAGPVPRDTDPAALALIAGTGGTTGVPKGVMLSHRNLLAFSAAFMALTPADSAPVHLVVAPMTHAAGALCFPIMGRGGTNVIMAKPDPQAILGAIAQHKVTDLFLPPTVIYALLAQPNVREFDYSSLRYFLYGAAPMSPAKLREALAVFGPVMMQAFGQTEAPMICTSMAPREHLDASGRPAGDERLTSCGRATPFVDVAVMGDDGELLPDGQAGELVVRGDLVMVGYYKNEAATADASRNGWHRTGDIGTRSPEGWFHIVDRKKDMIISGGFNIFSAEVEQALQSHPAVLDCAAIGVPDDKWGEAVKAVVQLKPGASADEAALIEHAKSVLGSVKAPKTVEIWPDLPRSTVGKVLKKDIRARYWEGRSRAI